MLTPEKFIKALADETRLRCALLLVAEGELCVCELGYALGESQPKISRHLALLRKGELFLDRKEGTWVHYRLHPALPPWAMTILQALQTGSDGVEVHRDDRARLKAMPDRPQRCCVMGA